MRAPKPLRTGTRIFFATAIGILLAGPLIFLIAGSLMSVAQVDAATPQFIPNSLHFDDYVNGWNLVLTARSFLNSVIFVVFAVGIQWALCISGGLAITKMRFRGRTAITSMFAVSLFIPIITTVIPVFVVTNSFALIDTYPGLIIPIAAQTGFGTLLFRQYIVTMPHELFDAARMDGAGWWLLLRRLVIPLARDRRLPRDLGDHRLEHVSMAAAGRERPTRGDAQRDRRADRRGRLVRLQRHHPAALRGDRHHHLADGDRVPARTAGLRKRSSGRLGRGVGPCAT
jgi:ABC-type spermidine/putrescine transport system permease subunit II